MNNNSPRATIIGFGAIILWAGLAFLVSFVKNIPAFQLVAMSFFIAFIIGLITSVIQRKNLFEIAKMPLKIWALGVGGLFGYHFLLFLAMQNAPVLQASLINYLWPLLIVLFSTLLPKSHGGGRLAWCHIIGALLGLFGVVLIVTNGSNFAFSSNAIFGHIAAGAAAFVWASYSVLSRLVSHIPTHAVTLFCLVTALLASFAHVIFEQTIVPQSLLQWLAILALGIGPVGGAFYLWDYAMKQGDIKILGAGAYLTPLLSTLILVGFGISQANSNLWLASIVISAGAMLAASGVFFAKNKD